MDHYLNWGLLIFGLALFLYSLRKPPLHVWITTFLLKAYVSTFIGVLIIEEGMLEYPVRFLEGYFDSNILYEYLLLPVVCIYFYKATYQVNVWRILGVGLLFTSGLTFVEALFEANTSLIEYHTWTWMHSFASIYIIMVLIRLLLKGIYKA